MGARLVPKDIPMTTGGLSSIGSAVVDEGRFEERRENPIQGKILMFIGLVQGYRKRGSYPLEGRKERKKRESSVCVRGRS